MNPVTSAPTASMTPAKSRPSTVRREIETTSSREKLIPRGHQDVGGRGGIELRYRLRVLGGAIDRDRKISREVPFRVRCRLSEHRIPDHEPRDLRADRLDDSREVPTENGREGERDEGVDISLHCIAIERIDASSVHADEQRPRIDAGGGDWVATDPGQTGIIVKAHSAKRKSDER